MLFQSMEMVRNELNNFYELNLGLQKVVLLENVASYETQASGGNQDKFNKKIWLTLVSIQEEKTLKNRKNYTINQTTGKTEYQNPPVYINMFLLFSSMDKEYNFALYLLSKIIEYFQGENTFSSTTNQLPASPINNAESQNEEFKLTLDLYTPGMEEINYLWSTLGGKQFPSVLYKGRLTKLQREHFDESGIITEINLEDEVI